MKRRELLAASAGCACWILAQNGQAATKITASSGPVQIGELKTFTQQGMDVRWLYTHGFILVRNQNQLYALSAICTHDHRTQIAGRTGGDKLVCPNHGSQFAQDGTVIRGPARHNLARFAIKVDGRGQVEVDTAKIFDEDKWGDPASLVVIS